MSLADIGAKYKANKPSGVFRWYEGLFAAYHGADRNLLEIGVKEGNSIRTWYDYGPRLHIHGLDLDITQIEGTLPEDRVEIGKVDQGSRESLESATKGRSYDIIIDDGSHWCSHQQLTLGYLFPKLKPGGVYIIEDLHTSQWDRPSAKEFHEDCLGPSDMTTYFLQGMGRRDYVSRFILDSEMGYLQQNILDLALHSCCFHKSGYRHNWGMSQQACIWKR